jgi:hypothetical protein
VDLTFGQFEQIVKTCDKFVEGAQNWRARRAALLLQHAGLILPGRGWAKRQVGLDVPTSPLL